MGSHLSLSRCLSLSLSACLFLATLVQGKRTSSPNNKRKGHAHGSSLTNPLLPLGFGVRWQPRRVWYADIESSEERAQRRSPSPSSTSLSFFFSFPLSLPFALNSEDDPLSTDGTTAEREDGVAVDVRRGDGLAGRSICRLCGIRSLPAEREERRFRLCFSVL